MKSIETDRAGWLALADECRDAEEPSDRLNAALAVAFNAFDFRIGDNGSWAIFDPAQTGLRYAMACRTESQEGGAAAARADMTRCLAGLLSLQPYTASIDATRLAIRKMLPGWAIRVGECHLSDDAWLCPDWNDPAHGARLRAAYGEPAIGHWTNDGIDIDRRPAGQPALALCEAACRAMAEVVGARRTGDAS